MLAGSKKPGDPYNLPEIFYTCDELAGFSYLTGREKNLRLDTKLLLSATEKAYSVENYEVKILGSK